MVWRYILPATATLLKAITVSTPYWIHLAGLYKGWLIRWCCPPCLHQHLTGNS